MLVNVSGGNMDGSGGGLRWKLMRVISTSFAI